MHVANPANPGHPGGLFGVPQHSGLDFVKFSIDLDTPQTAEIIEKPLKNIGFAMVFMYSPESLRNRKNAATERAQTLKMKARAAQTSCPGHQNERQELQNET